MVVVSALVPVAMLGDHDEAPVLVARRRPPVGIIQGPDRQATYETLPSVPFRSIPHRGSLAQCTQIGKCTPCHLIVCHLREVGRLNHTQAGEKSTHLLFHYAIHCKKWLIRLIRPLIRCKKWLIR